MPPIKIQLNRTVVVTWATRPCAAGLHSAVLASPAWPGSWRAPGWSAPGGRCLSPGDLRCRTGACPRPAAPGWSNAMNPPRAAWFNPSPATLAVPERPQDPPHPERAHTRTHAHTLCGPVTTLAAAPTPALAFFCQGCRLVSEGEIRLAWRRRRACEAGRWKFLQRSDSLPSAC